MQPFTLVLVRHGHVEGIHPERFRGQLDLPLTSLGREQAAVTAKFIAANWHACAVYTSPLARCKDTGTEIASAQGLTIQPIQELIDINYGQWQGRTRDEVKANEPEQFKAWMTQPQLTVIEGADSLQDVQARLVRGLAHMRKAHAGKTVVAVGHDSTNRVFLTLGLDMPLSRYWHLQQDPCAINVLHFDETGCKAIAINQTSHLSGMTITL